MLQEEDFGYDPSRFPDNLKDTIAEQFLCPICTCVAKEPHECVICGGLFCKICIQNWKKVGKQECPRGRCKILNKEIKPITVALSRIYNNLELKCKFDNCGKMFKISDIDKHEGLCQREKCQNFSLCGEHAASVRNLSLKLGNEVNSL